MSNDHDEVVLNEKLLLWDIDGTLMRAGGATKDAFFEALEATIGRSAVPTRVQFAGRTDLSIAREILTENGVVEGIDRQMVLLLRCFAAGMAQRRQQIKDEGLVLPGVFDLLKAMSKLDALNTTLTGNVAVNAVLKLSTFGLDEVIDLECGGFGGDKEFRSDLVEVVYKRVNRKYGASFDDEDVWIIGDTPHDLSAARENGIKVALVATGSYSYDELFALKPDAMFSDLSDTVAFCRALEIGEVKN